MEPLDYSNRPLGGMNSGNFGNQTLNIAPVLSDNMNMSTNASKFQMNPMGHVYVQASSLMNSFMLQDGNHTYGSPSMSFAHLSHHFNSIRGQDQGLLPQPNHNNFQYPMNQMSANGSPGIPNTVSSISASSDAQASVPNNTVSRPVSESQIDTSATPLPYANAAMNHSTAPSSTSSNLPSFHERSAQNDHSTNDNTTTTTSNSNERWSDQSEPNDTKLSAQQLRLQRETQEERERRLVAGRERMRLYRARERMLESPEEKERRLAIARERTRLGRALESPDQRERRLKKTRERLRMKRQMESQDERDRRLKQHRENKRERYHKMSPDERSMMRRTSGQRTRSVSSGSSQSDCDQTSVSQRSNQRDDSRTGSLGSQWNNDLEAFPFGLEVKVEPDDVLNRVNPAPSQPASSSADSSLPPAARTAVSTGTSALQSTSGTGSINQTSLRLPPDKATQYQAALCGGSGSLLYPPLPPNIVTASATHQNFNYDFKPSSAGILQTIRPLRFASPVPSQVGNAHHYPNSPHLSLPNYHHRDLCNSLNPT